MYKVSFTGNFKKVERFNNKVTKVTLEGIINNIYTYDPISIPTPVYEWMASIIGPHINIIKMSGTAVRNDKDKDDPVLGERLAEARAKLKIYKFMKTFCYKMLKYYALKLYGINTKNNINTITVRAIDQESYVNSLQKAYKKYSRLVDVENTHIKQLLYDY